MLRPLNNFKETRHFNICIEGKIHQYVCLQIAHTHTHSKHVRQMTLMIYLNHIFSTGMIIKILDWFDIKMETYIKIPFCDLSLQYCVPRSCYDKYSVRHYVKRFTAPVLVYTCINISLRSPLVSNVSKWSGWNVKVIKNWYVLYICLHKVLLLWWVFATEEVSLYICSC